MSNAVVLTITVPSSLPSGQKKFEIERRLASVIDEIEAEKKLSFRRVIFLIKNSFVQEAMEKPWTTMLKCTLFASALAALYPVAIGSLACLNSYRVEQLSNIISSNLEKANIAVQIYSNVGQGIMYVVQEFELLLIPSAIWLFKDSYNRAMCREITSVYTRKLQQNTDLDSASRAFLIQRANRELSIYGGAPILNGIELIQKQIATEKKQLFSKCNIINLVGREVIKDAKNSSCGKNLTVTVAGVALLTLSGLVQHPLIYGTLACFAAFRVQSPQDLDSSDIDDRTNATALYSNLGHVVEYIITVFAVVGLAAKILLQKKYKVIACRLIEQIYNKHIQNESLPKETSDLLYKLKQKELGLYSN